MIAFDIPFQEDIHPSADDRLIVRAEKVDAIGPTQQFEPI
jgi:hypothetical protein